MKVGILGLGAIGWRHAINLRDLGHEVIAFDPKAGDDFRIRQRAESLGIGLSSRDLLFVECDAVVIATPSNQHHYDLFDCVNAGKHAFVEKPIATSRGGYERAYEAIRRAGSLVTMMGNNLRFHSCVQLTRRWLDTGVIGNPIWALFICAAHSAKAPYLSDGVILNTGAHEVDLALHLLGPARVLSATARIGEYGDDIADFVLEHLNGCRSTFHIDLVTPKEIREYRLVSEESDLHCDLPARYMLGSFSDAKLPGITHTQRAPIKGSYDTDYLDEMRAFIDRIEGKDVPGATGEDGFNTLDILLEVRSKAGIAPR